MIAEILNGLLLPFWGTSIGAALVLVFRGQAPKRLEQVLSGAAAGIMAAASVFSLLLPAMEETEQNGGVFWLPACFGFLLGAGLLAAWDRISLLRNRNRRVSHSTRMLVLSVSLHNVPEGMAVGAAYAGLLAGSAAVTSMSAFALALGIALQNLPEGAIVSMPLYADGVGRRKAFLLGVLSGASEPVAGGLTILLARFAVPALPWLLSFAAGAMAYVVGFELIFGLLKDRSRRPGLPCVLGGFLLMTLMDVLLG
jgi:ZIP family zinc transporter